MQKILSVLLLMVFSLSIIGCSRSVSESNNEPGASSGVIENTLSMVLDEVFVHQNNMTVTMTLEGDNMDGTVFLLQFDGDKTYFELNDDDDNIVRYYMVLEAGTLYTYMLLEDDQWFRFPVFDETRSLGLLEIFTDGLQADWFEEMSRNKYALKTEYFEHAFGIDATNIEVFTIELLSNGRAIWIISGHDDDEPMQLQMNFSHFGTTVIDLPDFNLSDNQDTQANEDTIYDGVRIFYPENPFVVEQYHLDLYSLTVELEIADVEFHSDGDTRNLSVFFRAKLLNTVRHTPMDVMLDILLFDDNNELIRTRRLIAYDLEIDETECCFQVYFGLNLNKSTSYRVVIETRQDVE